MKKIMLTLSALAVCTGMLTSCASGSTDDTDGTSVYVKSTYDESTGSFISNFIGIGAKFDPELWSYDNDMISDLNNGADTEKELFSIIKENSAGNIYELYLTGKGDMKGTSIAVGVTYAANMSEKEAALALAENAGYLSGLTEAEGESGLVSFAGEDHACVEITGKRQELDISERLIYIKKGDYFGMVTVVCSENNDTEMIDKITGLFYGL